MTLEVAKKILNSYRMESERVNILRAQLEEVDSLAQSIRSPEITGMPHGNSTTDKTGKYAVRIKSILDSLEEAEDSAERAWNELQKIISQMPENTADDTRRRVVLELRYLDLLSWTRVTRGLYGQKPDFEARKESYYRQVTRIHGRALKAVCAVLEGRKHDDDRTTL